MDRVCKLANLYVASLRAIYLIAQYSHWRTHGLGFYGSHLMLERIYQAAQKSADFAAEKFIGTLGETCVDYASQTQYLGKMLAKYQDRSMEELALVLAIVKDFLAFGEQVAKEFEEEGSMSLGLANLFEQVSSDTEEWAYLLQQALDEQKGTHDE